MDEHGHLGTSKSEIDRAVVLCNGQRGLTGLFVVGGHHNRHVGEHLHHTDVFQNLVGPIFTQGQTCVGCTNFDVLFRVSNALANLVIHPSGGKIGKCACEGHSCRQWSSLPRHPSCWPRQCQPGRIDWEGIFEGIHFQRACQVGTEADNLVIGLSSFKKTLAKPRPRVFGFGGIECDVVRFNHGDGGCWFSRIGW